MARPVRPWFRFYTEACSDRKLRRMKPEYRWLYVACLAAARVSPEPGVLLVSDGDPMTVDDIADYAGMEPRAVRYGLKALVDQGLLVEDSDIVRDSFGDRSRIVRGSFAYRSPTFQHRQYESDTSAARTRKWRATREDAEDVTSQPRHSDGDSDNQVTDQITETETETDTDRKNTRPKADEEAFDRFWSAYPRRIAKGAARRSWKTATTKTDADTIIVAASAFTARVGAKDPKYIPHPSTWLNQERWSDEPDPDFTPKSRQQQDLDSMFERQMARAAERDQRGDDQWRAIGA